MDDKRVVEIYSKTGRPVCYKPALYLTLHVERLIHGFWLPILPAPGMQGVG